MQEGISGDRLRRSGGASDIWHVVAIAVSATIVLSDDQILIWLIARTQHRTQHTVFSVRQRSLSLRRWRQERCASQQLRYSVCGLRAIHDPVHDAFSLETDVFVPSAIGYWIVRTELLKMLAVARRLGVRGNDAIKWEVLTSETLQAQLDHRHPAQPRPQPWLLLPGPVLCLETQTPQVK